MALPDYLSLLRFSEDWLREFLASHRPLPPSLAEAFYSLGERDPDPGMGRAMMADIVALPECPANVRERAAASGEQVRRLEVSVYRGQDAAPKRRQASASVHNITSWGIKRAELRRGVRSVYRVPTQTGTLTTKRGSQSGYPLARR